MISILTSKAKAFVFATALSCFCIARVALADPHDGTGTMTVSPTIVNVGNASNSFTFSFLEGNPGKFPDNSLVTIAVPSTWTPPQTTNSSSPGYVSATVVGSDIIRSVSASGSGPWTISILFKGHDSASGFNVTYAGGGSEVTAPASTGVNTFTTMSQGGTGGILTGIALNPSITVIDPNVAQPIFPRGTPTAGTTTSTKLVINKPVGLVIGDVMIVNIEAKGNKIFPSLAGWTPIAYAPIESGGATHHGAVLYRIANSSDSSVLSYTFNLGAGATAGSGVIVAYSGVDTTGGFLVGGGAGGPFDVAPGNWTTNTSGSASITGVTAITTATPNAAVLMFVAAFDNANSVSGFSTPSLGALASSYSLANANGTVGAGWTLNPAVGSSGTGSATLGASQKWGAILLALKPVAASITYAPLTITSLGGGSYLIKGVGVAGRTYRIQFTDSLSTPNWQDLPSGSVTADGSGNFQVTDTSASGMRFYRSVYP